MKRLILRGGPLMAVRRKCIYSITATTIIIVIITKIIKVITIIV